MTSAYYYIYAIISAANNMYSLASDVIVNSLEPQMPPPHAISLYHT
jgi:hypothetical protein